MIYTINRYFRLMLAVLIAVSQVASGFAAAQEADTEAPVLIHRQADSAGVAGELQTFLARVSDDFEVESVTLYYRQNDEGGFTQIPMRALFDSLDEYMIAVETVESAYPGLQYYIEARDAAGNMTSRGFEYAPIVLPLEPAAVIADNRPVTTPVAAPPPAPESSGLSTRTLIIGLGALVLLGAVAGSAGGGGGGGGATDPGTNDTVTLTIITDAPSAN
jgi:hypothetical protein